MIGVEHLDAGQDMKTVTGIAQNRLREFDFIEVGNHPLRYFPRRCLLFLG